MGVHFYTSPKDDSGLILQNIALRADGLEGSTLTLLLTSAQGPWSRSGPWTCSGWPMLFYDFFFNISFERENMH